MRRRIALAGLVMLIATTSAAQATSAQAAVPTQRPLATAGSTAQGKTVTVTLITGDIVTATIRGSGCPLVSVRPASPGRLLSRSCGPDGHVRVVPADAVPLLGKVLDPTLFDVTALIKDGYDDAHSADTPLIIAEAAVTAVTADPFGTALRGRRALPSIHAVAGRQPKSAAAKFVTAMHTFTATAAPSHVWLDRKVRANTDPRESKLDPNLTQVGAPEAWREGYTGKGARVAVLDTGVDATHPDLVGRIVESANFAASSSDTVDRFGHGTHVAATIAGTGAASGGQRRGVAPDAGLLIGKVLGDDGSGTDADVIAGMEWAAQRANVVNMSLGGWDSSDGTDPLSQTLDALSKQYGTLFVVAAGNSGPSDSTVSSPGAAESALTVGAVDATGTLADFSSRGPLVNTRAVKPEILAPGVDIVAARAAGTSMGRLIDDRYTAASGTSMATPHVAGAAAILAQRHPDWRAPRLKAALVGGADPARGGDTFAVGAGRLDIPDSLHAAVVPAQSVASLGTLSYPQSGTAETKLSWTNTGSSPMNLLLSLALNARYGASTPAGAASLSATSVRIEPGGSASVVLRVDAAALAAKPGLYEGLVTARTGSLALRTPVAFFVEPPSYDLTVRATALPDTPDGATFAFAGVANIEDPALFNTLVYLDSGSATIRVPAGRYSIVGEVHDVTTGATRIALAGDADVTVNRDSAVVLDGARAHLVSATVDGVTTETNAVSVFFVQTPKHGQTWWEGPIAWPTDSAPYLRGSIYAAPIDRVGVGSLNAYEYFSLDAPGTGASPFLYDLMPTLGDHIADDVTYRVTDAERSKLARIDQHFQHLDLPGSTTSHKRYGLTPDGAFAGENSSGETPANRVDYVSPGILWADEAFYSGVVDYPAVTQEAFTQYQPGSRQDKVWASQPLRPDWYDAPDSLSFCQPDPIRRTRGNLHVVLVELADAHQRFDCLEGDEKWETNTKKLLTLYRNGQKIGETAGIRADFTIPADESSYRLAYDLDTSALMPVCTHISTAWTFRSAAPSGNQSAQVPLLSVDYALPLDSANHPAGKQATFTVRQTTDASPQQITSFQLWTSTDDGASWTAALTKVDGNGRFTAQLPDLAAGQAMSLRVSASGSAGSGVEQTITRAYRAS